MILTLIELPVHTLYVIQVQHEGYKKLTKQFYCACQGCTRTAKLPYCTSHVNLHCRVHVSPSIHKYERTNLHA